MSSDKIFATIVISVVAVITVILAVITTVFDSWLDDSDDNFYVDETVDAASIDNNKGDKDE